MKKFLGVLISFSLSQAAMADIKCERDMRPVDGNYEAVELVKNSNGRFDAFYAVITAGFGSPVSNTRVLIAKNLKCTFKSSNPMITECLKSGSEEGEDTNSGLNIKLVEENSVSGETSSFHINAYSPQLYDNYKQPGYPHTERRGSAKFSFKAEGNSGILTNRCVRN